MQERVLRAVLKFYSETYEELLRRAKLPTLYKRCLQDIMILMYKVRHGFNLVPQSISDLFVCKGTRYLLKNSDFLLPRFNTVCFGKHSVRFSGPFLWSKHSSDLRNLPSLNSFKNSIRKQGLAGLISNNDNCCNLCTSYNRNLGAYS